MTINSTEEKFYQIFDLLSKKEPDISIGKMMSSPGIKYKSKVIAFYHDDEMIFRIGKRIDLTKHGIKNPRYLSPFKSKSSMTGWICLSFSYEKRWDEFAATAIDLMISEID